VSHPDIWVVFLAGGVGSRFWPLSTPRRPKQLLPLVTDQPLLVDAVDRLRPLVDPSQILILTNASLVDAIAEVLPDVPRENLVAEPEPKGTAPALAWAALTIRARAGDSAVMISVHADWAVKDADGFRRTLRAAAAAAARRRFRVGGTTSTTASTAGSAMSASGSGWNRQPCSRAWRSPASRSRRLIAARRSSGTSATWVR